MPTPKDAKDQHEEATKEDDGQTYIVYREPVMEANNVQSFKEHRVKTEDWAAYEKEHNL